MSGKVQALPIPILRESSKSMRPQQWRDVLSRGVFWPRLYIICMLCAGIIYHCFKLRSDSKGIGTGIALIGDVVAYHQLPAALSYTTRPQQRHNLGFLGFHTFQYVQKPDRISSTWRFSWYPVCKQCRGLNELVLDQIVVVFRPLLLMFFFIKTIFLFKTSTIPQRRYSIWPCSSDPPGQDNDPSPQAG